MPSLTALLILAITGANAATIDFDQIFGGSNSSSSSCPGTVVEGYCCNGSVINPSGDLMNGGDNDVSGLTCCVGDPSLAFNNGGPQSCTAGSAVPLTEAAGATAAAGSVSGSTVASPSAAATDDSSGDTAITTEAGSSQATETASTESSGASSGDSGSAASSGVVTQSSAGGAAVVTATLAPALGGTVAGMAALL